MTTQTEQPRFAFGRNWSAFLRLVDEERIAMAEASLRDMLGVETLSDRRFLDIGSGSGLFSLAARRMDARVHSFDYDAESVRCTETLRERFSQNDADWTVERGSVLDAGYMRGLGTFDVVYSWGVLHHTGDMRAAMDHAAAACAPGGLLFIALYNTQPLWTPLYTAIKRAYVHAPVPGRAAILGLYAAFHFPRMLAADLLRLRDPSARYRAPRLRGMSEWHDLKDWVGGYPFETATPDEVTGFFTRRGFALQRIRTVGRRNGCNEFVLRRGPAKEPAP